MDIVLALTHITSTYKAIEVGYNPEMILAGRRLNDSMGAYVAEQIIRLMTKNHIHIVDANVLIMGLTLKENCQTFEIHVLLT